VAVLCCSALVIKMANTFTNEEHADIHLVYGFCNRNGRATVEEYRQYPLRKLPHRDTIENIHRTLLETGSFPRANAECEQRRRGEDVLAARQRSPSTNICRMSRVTGVAETQVWKILYRDDSYPYHLQLVHHLLSGDEGKRVRFCEWLQPRIRILRDILFTDEAEIYPGWY
jgi:hypothetical protein